MQNQNFSMNHILRKMIQGILRIIILAATMREAAKSVITLRYIAKFSSATA
jgi:hypothetical protein